MWGIFSIPAGPLQKHNKSGFMKMKFNRNTHQAGWSPTLEKEWCMYAKCSELTGDKHTYTRHCCPVLKCPGWGIELGSIRKSVFIPKE